MVHPNFFQDNSLKTNFLDQKKFYLINSSTGRKNMLQI